ncbi:MAG: DUF1579 family protein [Planctomycetota bacterium]|nr:DUF1579 family protein [Planctomycetota bacterium]
MPLRLMATLVPVLFCGQLAPAQHAPGSHPPSLHEVMAQAMRSTQPTPEHALLTDLVGEWSYVLQMSMPEMPLLRGTGTTTIKPIIGGRFIEMRSTSTEQDPPTESVGLLGYDSRKGREQYFMLWLDSMGHYFTDASGRWNPATGTLTFLGEEVDPATGMNSSYRQAFRFPGKDTMICDVYVTVPGNNEEMLLVSVVYERRQPDETASSATADRAQRTFAERMREQSGIGRAIDRIGTATPPAVPGYSAAQIEAMDRLQLQTAMLEIMRARTMSEVESASRSTLDDQYEAAMSRMRALSSTADGSAKLDRQGQPEPPPIPAFTPQEIDLMDSGDVREALMSIAAARRRPDLGADQKAKLQELFGAIYQQMLDIRESRTDGSMDGADQD